MREMISPIRFLFTPSGLISTSVCSVIYFATVLILMPGYLGRKYSYTLGSLLQVLLLVVSFYVPWMLLIAIIFVGFWGWAMIAGTTIDLAKKARDKVDTFEITIETKESN
ncbi:MAG: DUF4233 domain-containing protein [Microbacteriaceae bacterium]|nr:DUF4233 domain-containing protein [Microbacteriaceae bacterium]